MSVNLNITPGSTSTGSGIDVTAVVDQILYSERAPERIWQSQQSTLSLEASALNGLNSNLTALADKVNALKDSFGALNGISATSSQTAVLTASAQNTAANLTHQIVVKSLATTSSQYTDPVTTDTLSDGTFTINLGDGSTHDVQIDSTHNTLDGLVSYINGQDFGVTASVISDANGSRLALVSKTSGDAGNITITGNDTGLAFNSSAEGKNASLTIDGVPVSSATNTVTGAIQGITLNLTSAAPDSVVLLTVGPNTAGAKQAVNDFVSSYNTLINSINGQFATTSAAGTTAGPLASNSSLRSLQSSLLADVTYSISGNNGYVNLASIGVDMANDGTLSVNDSTLDDVLANHFSDFKNLFQSLTGDTGFAYNFSNDLTTLNDPITGIINANLTQNTSVQNMLTDQINELEDRLVDRQKQLIDEYSRVDAMLRQFPMIMAQITSQLGVIQTTSK